jgi:protoporphyrin/coproporphyrin ferrochelatase
VLARNGGHPGHVFNLGHGVLPETDPACSSGWSTSSTRRAGAMTVVERDAEGPVGLGVVMAYGTPRRPEDVEAYYTHIRRGKAPTPELLAELTARYDAIGGISPLAERTEAQRAAIERGLEARRPGRWRVVLGQKHAAPFIEDAVAALADDGVDPGRGPGARAPLLGVQRRPVPPAGRGGGRRAGDGVQGVDHWHLLPAYVDFLTDAVAEARTALPARHKVLFTAHSLPERVLVDDPYPDELRQSAEAVASRLGLSPWADWALGWQSAGPHPRALAGPRRPRDHRRAGRHRPDRRRAGLRPGLRRRPPRGALRPRHRGAPRWPSEAGLTFARTRSLNDDPAVMDSLADLVVDEARPTTASARQGPGEPERRRARGLGEP